MVNTKECIEEECIYAVFQKQYKKREIYNMYVGKCEDLLHAEAAYNAVISYMLGKGYCEEPLEFLRCWKEGNFDALREEWPDAPEEIYLADPLYKGNKL